MVEPGPLNRVYRPCWRRAKELQGPGGRARRSDPASGRKHSHGECRTHSRDPHACGRRPIRSRSWHSRLRGPPLESKTGRITLPSHTGRAGSAPSDNRHIMQYAWLSTGLSHRIPRRCSPMPNTNQDPRVNRGHWRSGERCLMVDRTQRHSFGHRSWSAFGPAKGAK